MTREMNCLASGGYALNPTYKDNYRGLAGTKTLTVDTSKAYIVTGVIEGTAETFDYYVGVGETTGTVLHTDLAPANVQISISGTTMTIVFDTSGTYVTNATIIEL